MYINDLPKASNLKALLFADDTALFASENIYTSLEKLVNIEVKKIETWLFKNKLSLNNQKSTIVMFGEKIITNKINIQICNDKIPQSDQVKYLGIVIDKHLNGSLILTN